MPTTTKSDPSKAAGKGLIEMATKESKGATSGAVPNTSTNAEKSK
jgi:hypothetical protein